MTTALTRQEQTDLRTCETVISKGINTFREVGKALAKIRDAKLYKGEYKTFESYCNTRWGFGKAYAYRLIEASDVPEVSPTGDKIDTEHKARKHLEQQKAEAKADPNTEPKPRTVVAEFDFDHDQDDQSPGAEPPRVVVDAASAEADRAGGSSDDKPVDRIALVARLQEEAFVKYVHAVGEDAIWSCWLAGQEKFNLLHETT